MVKTVCNNYRQLAPVLFGKGAINKTGDVAVELGCKKAMIVTDEGINGLGFPKKIEDSLKEKGIEEGQSVKIGDMIFEFEDRY